jgi:hypothetical protein
VHLTDLVVHARVEKDALGSRRLPGIDVSHDADIPVLFERSSHGMFLRCEAAWEIKEPETRKPSPSPATSLGSLSSRRGLRLHLLYVSADIAADRGASSAQRSLT